MQTATLAVIGGSGFYEMEGITDLSEVKLSTPFGEPSDSIVLGTLEGAKMAFLPRHGRGHRKSPSEVNYRANIFALKTLGVRRIISISAVGSMRESIRPLDLVVPDQIYDRTKSRKNTFFEDGIVAHVGLAEPFCPELSGRLVRAARDVVKAASYGPEVHEGGVYVCIEGPQFSTKAESRIYRGWGVDLIGMTAVPEAKLAREAEICYAMLACSTDYDVWHESEEAVTVELVINNLVRNVALAKEILREVAKEEAALASGFACACESALSQAIITARDSVPESARERLRPIVGKYFA